MTPDEIKSGAEALGSWYHKIELTPGYFTPAYANPNMQDQWKVVREVREGITYFGRSVLDCGTMDGMWAFEAEWMDAPCVRAIDVWQGGYTKARERFQFAKKALNSRVELVEASVEDNLSAIFTIKFDIIQCLGLLYHLENPLLALRQLRKVVADNGVMLLETAVWPGNGQPYARFNSDRGIYHDPTTFWAMNSECLEGALALTGWSIKDNLVKGVPAGPTVRHAMICKPI